MSDDVQVVLGDCVEVLRSCAGASFDSMVTDPPAGISFMGKSWDSYESLLHFQDEMVTVFKECLRVLKPGAHGLVWALPRTSHHTGMALERAGFELRDMVLHLFGTGMPKGQNVAKAGAGEEWAGWNTTLKPAHEVWWLVRKPLAEKTVVAQVLATGTGAINIDECRVGTSKEIPWGVKSGRLSKHERKRTYSSIGVETGSESGLDPNIGRWPANVALSHSPGCADTQCVEGCPVAVLDGQSGHLSSHGGGTSISFAGGVYGEPPENRRNIPHGDTGGASRFFYTSKVPPAERNLPDGTVNNHPTVKSVKLMRYFVKLVTPKGGTVLDPFMGSGTTGVAAKAERMGFYGVEQAQEHYKVAVTRINGPSLDNSEIPVSLSQELTEADLLSIALSDD